MQIVIATHGARTSALNIIPGRTAHNNKQNGAVVYLLCVYWWHAKGHSWAHPRSAPRDTRRTVVTHRHATKGGDRSGTYKVTRSTQPTPLVHGT